MTTGSTGMRRGGRHFANRSNPRCQLAEFTKGPIDAPLSRPSIPYGGAPCHIVRRQCEARAVLSGLWASGSKNVLFHFLSCVKAKKPATAFSAIASLARESMSTSQVPPAMSPKRIFQVATSDRRIMDEADCVLACAKLGVSPSVLVSEGLGFLGERMDIHFNSLSNMAMYKGDVETIMNSMKSSQGKGSFSRFAHALYQGYKQEGEVYNAVVRSGMTIFWDVLEAVATDNPENEPLNAMKGANGREAEFRTLKAWSKVFLLLEERHQRSHPFNFIKGDMELAEDAFEVFKFIALESKNNKYKDLLQVMHATIPIIAKKIDEKKLQLIELKALEEIQDQIVCQKLRIRKLL